MPKTRNAQKIQIIYKNIDFVKLKITNDLLPFFLSKSSKEYDKFTFSDLRMKDFTWYKIFDKYFIVNFWEISNKTKHRFDIVDKDKNKYWNIIFTLKEYKSNIPYLELWGLFFKTNDVQVNENDEKLPYMLRFDLFHEFLEYFSISTKERSVIKNLQFCCDFSGREVFQILKYLKKWKDYKKVPVLDLTAFDYKKLMQKEGRIEYWKVTTGLTIPWTYNKLIVYDKILEQLQVYLWRLINWVNPYQDYINSDVPICRIEVEKKSAAFSHIEDNSMEWIFENIEALYFDYLTRYFKIDFRKFSTISIENLNWKTNHFAKKKKEMKLLHSMNMFNAYSKNLQVLMWKWAFEKYCLSKFPDLQQKHITDYLDEFEILDHLYFNDEKWSTSYKDLH